MLIYKSAYDRDQVFAKQNYQIRKDKYELLLAEHRAAVGHELHPFVREMAEELISNRQYE